MEVIHSRLEELDLPAKVDVLVSEPMGTLLVNERMLETYLYARDHFLKPGGRMFPVSTEQCQSSACDTVKTAMGNRALCVCRLSRGNVAHAPGLHLSCHVPLRLLSLGCASSLGGLWVTLPGASCRCDC